MGQSIHLNFEYIADHVSDYIENENLFTIFELEDIETIMKYSHLTADQYISLLKQSHSTITPTELYICTRNANVIIQNFQDVISILESVKKFMNFNIFDNIISSLNHNTKEILDSSEKLKNFKKN